jgi:hypothetical protein
VWALRFVDSAEFAMSHTLSVLQPTPKMMAPPQRPVQPTQAAVQVLRVVRASTQLSFQFHRVP